MSGRETSRCQARIERLHTPTAAANRTSGAGDFDHADVYAVRRAYLKFDFTRFEPNAFGGWDQDRRVQKTSAADLFYTLGVSANASYANGCMILRPAATVDDLIQDWKEEEDPKNKQYATFKIHDWKNKRLVETSCAPAFLSNYFQQSDKPFEISPAFFRPEVLTRFKNDPEKYDLQDRSISCRNAWYLKTYDINVAGQVHTYIGYLADLPYEEQCYWQSFNELPRGPISPRAYESDFLGAFSSEYDPLRALNTRSANSTKIRQLGGSRADRKSPMPHDIRRPIPSRHGLMRFLLSISC